MEQIINTYPVKLRKERPKLEISEAVTHATFFRFYTAVT